MRITSLFAFILVSVSLLSESYHYAGAIGIDSASHGLLRGGRVVRRYGVSGGTLRALKKRQQQQQQQQLDPPTRGRSRFKNGGGNHGQQIDVKAPTQQAPAQEAPAQQAPAQSPTPIPKNKGKVNQSDQDATDTTIRPPGGQQQNQQNTQGSQDQSDSGQPQNGSNGIPTVATSSVSPQVIGGLASVGGVFVLVGGLFAFSQRRKNKEIVKNIVSNSSKAWEQQQQNSVYEVMEEETKPIGIYTVVAIYTPTLSDELEIQLGDKVAVLVEYDDGWVQGVNETRGGTKGVFPRHCVDMDNIDSSNKTKNIKRSSSMGVYAEGYTEVDLN